MQQHDKGFLIALAGVVLTLLWIGVFKFTPTEAAAIKPLVASHPLMSWLYGPLSEQGVSNLIGLAEIVIAVGLVVGLWQPRIGYWSSMGAIVTFLVTLSFLLTLTGVWKVVDGVPVTEFFIFKDLVFLGVVLHYQHRICASLPARAA
ncbi:DUF417 family protein [Aeromonas enteropelogenes]|uniref:DUF417 family protein n=1 Tax=Aeromonas enteropelogenes TaxID=29489 RepID=UPI00228694C6|nr:DUF417 family protein [Aeromonas enteropelogenes]MCZ0753113.1 DUF417 family protein [Aeromonas enteropelogenes]